MAEGNCKRTIGVIGGGFSGVMTASHLARLGEPQRVKVILIERFGPPGKGVAYSTTAKAHLLNVPAGNMSAFPDQPQHFVEWAKKRDSSVKDGSFLPRTWYGEYLSEICADHARRFSLTVVRGEANDLQENDEGVVIHLIDGRTIPVGRAVIAGSNFAPSNPGIEPMWLLDSPRYVRDPWASNVLAEMSRDEPVLLIGTGLTAIDVALQLQAQGHEAQIHAVSRRGLMPQPHRAPGRQQKASIPREMADAPRTAVGLLRALRAGIRRMESLGFDWRDVVASLRPITSELWRSLNTAEQARFLRHLRPFWDVHRHRTAPVVAETITKMREQRRLVTHAARIVGAEQHASQFIIRLRPRGNKHEEIVQAAWVINCTGPGSDIRRTSDPLWSNLYRKGRCKSDEHGLGALTSNEGALLDQTDTASDRLFLVGPLRKAQLWENTAVPELRVQAKQMAEHLIERVGQDDHSLPAQRKPRKVRSKFLKPKTHQVSP